MSVLCASMTEETTPNGSDRRVTENQLLQPREVHLHRRTDGCRCRVAGRAGAKSLGLVIKLESQVRVRVNAGPAPDAEVVRDDLAQVFLSRQAGSPFAGSPLRRDRPCNSASIRRQCM